MGNNMSNSMDLYDMENLKAKIMSKENKILTSIFKKKSIDNMSKNDYETLCSNIKIVYNDKLNALSTEILKKFVSDKDNAKKYGIKLEVPDEELSLLKNLPEGNKSEKNKSKENKSEKSKSEKNKSEESKSEKNKSEESQFEKNKSKKGESKEGLQKKYICNKITDYYIKKLALLRFLYKYINAGVYQNYLVITQNYSLNIEDIKSNPKSIYPSLHKNLKNEIINYLDTLNKYLDKLMDDNNLSIKDLNEIEAITMTYFFVEGFNKCCEAIWKMKAFAYKQISSPDNKDIKIRNYLTEKTYTSNNMKTLIQDQENEKVTEDNKKKCSLIMNIKNMKNVKLILDTESEYTEKKDVTGEKSNKRFNFYIEKFSEQIKNIQQFQFVSEEGEKSKEVKEVNENNED